MLFNSYPFLLGFFPIVLLLFFILGRRNQLLAAGWLAVASLFFYGYWSPAALPLLIVSVCMNYRFGLLVTPDERRTRRPLLAKSLLTPFEAVNRLGLRQKSDIRINLRNMAKSPRIAVVGSANIDLTTFTDQFPKPGETILNGVLFA